MFKILENDVVYVGNNFSKTTFLISADHCFFVHRLLRLLRQLQIASLSCKRSLKAQNLLKRSKIIKKHLIKIKKVKMKMIRSARLLLKDLRKPVKTQSLAKQVLNDSCITNLCFQCFPTFDFILNLWFFYPTGDKDYWQFCGELCFRSLAGSW